MPLRIRRIQSGIFFFPVLHGVGSGRAAVTATAFDGLGGARVSEKA